MGTYESDRYEDVVAALADPALVPEPVPPVAGAVDGAAGGTMAWLRATVARFCAGEPHARRRALVEGELARLAPEAVRRAARARGGCGADDEDVRVTAVAALAACLGYADPEGVARAVTVVAGGYFGGDGPDPAGDEAVRWLLPRVGGDAELAANRIGILVQACDATAALVAHAARGRRAGETVEELLARTLREDPPLRVMRRRAVAATRVGGTEIVPGDTVVLRTAEAAPPSVTLAFGAAPRRCPGEPHALALATGILETRPLGRPGTGCPAPNPRPATAPCPPAQSPAPLKPPGEPEGAPQGRGELRERPPRTGGLRRTDRGSPWSDPSAGSGEVEGTW
ncbi:hypothetical protein [Streptomyces sp. NPDC048172]|uniref:hypothetical protein n=1 Tax=Streptomyces sp. NPDC048172 TaxID=3365505 RepID=UPI00371B0EA7